MMHTLQVRRLAAVAGRKGKSNGMLVAQQAHPTILRSRRWYVWRRRF
jgi:hypothetical protein